MKYVLLGEKNVAVFEINKHDNNVDMSTITYDDFHILDHKNIPIIIDRSDVDFSLEILKNCNIIDAYKILSCRQKLTNEKAKEDAFFISDYSINFLQKHDFYMQINRLNKSMPFYDSINFSDGIFLMEHIIAEFCRRLATIEEKTWWMYIAKHKSSGTKIVAGIGSGIVISRIISASSNHSTVAAQTIRYLRRHGLQEEIKIISSIQNLQIENLQIENLEIIKYENKNEDTEIDLINFFSKHFENIRPVFASRNRFMLFVQHHSRKLYWMLSTTFIALCALLFYLQNQFITQTNIIHCLETTTIADTEDLSHTMKINVNDINVDFMRQLIKILKASQNPLPILKNISHIIKENNINAKTIYIEKCNCVKIKCVLNEKQMDKLRNLSNNSMQIKISKTDTHHSEYENIGEHLDKNFEAEICINIKTE
jgi:hypothetical protein